MVTRVAKHEFARLLRGVEGHLIAHATSHFLNCLLGDAKACSTGFDLNELTEDGTVHYPLKSDLPNGHGPHDATSANKGSKKKKGKKADSQAQHHQQQQQPKEAKKQPTPTGEIFSLSSQSLWKTIHELVQERFDYDLSNPVAEETKEGKLSEFVRKRVRDLATLRSFCLKVGVQVIARNYSFTQSEPFKRSDILEIYPLVKHMNPRVILSFFFSLN